MISTGTDGQTAPDESYSPGVSILALGSRLVRSRWRIARWMVIGGLLSGIYVFTKPRLYEGSASFISQGNDKSSGGLASLAGQFGVSLPMNNQSLSNDFYARLLKSPTLLVQVARDTVVVAEEGNRREALLDLLKIPSGPVSVREERAVKALATMVRTSVGKTTGLVELSIQTRWPSVSLRIVSDLVNGLNEFNLRTRQSQAAQERKFVEGRVALASTELRAAEDRLEAFMRENRQFAGSPELTFQRDRLQRSVGLAQQVYTTLMQNYEDVRIREVRDTPVLTVVEGPSVHSLPEPRGAVRGAFVGMIVGGLLCVIMILVPGVLMAPPKRGVDDAEELREHLAEAKQELLRPVRWIGARVRR